MEKKNLRKSIQLLFFFLEDDQSCWRVFKLELRRWATSVD